MMTNNMNKKIKDQVTAEDMIKMLALEKKSYSFPYFNKIRRYLTGILIGMCFEYVYRVDSHVWYLPFSIGILLSVSAIIDILKK